MSRNRAGALSLAAAGVLFVLYPAIRPWHDESTVSGATASMSSTAWVTAHLLRDARLHPGTAGPAGSRGRPQRCPVGLARARRDRGHLDRCRAGPAVHGAEDFGLHAIASKHAGNLLDLIKAVRYQPLAITIFGASLLTLAAGAVLAAVAIWRSGVLPRYSGILFAIGFALFLPQFYLPPAARISHGMLTGTGLAMLGMTLAHQAKPTRRPALV